MNNQKGSIIIPLLIALVLSGAGAYWYINNVDEKYQVQDFNYNAQVQSEEDEFDSESSVVQDQNAESEEVNVDRKTEQESNDLLEEKPDVSEEWELINQLSEYQKAGDLNGIKSLILAENTDCSGEECEIILEFFGIMIDSIRETEFINIWKDDKQTIFTTEIKENITEDSVLLSRDAMFFAVDEEGDLKFLGFSTNSQGQNLNGTDRSLEDILEELRMKMSDLDKDGVSDYLEGCEQSQSSSCIDTDPQKRDTDGDGYWDGIEDQVSFQ
jgi:hypothetical protein